MHINSIQRASHSPQWRSNCIRRLRFACDKRAKRYLRGLCSDDSLSLSSCLLSTSPIKGQQPERISNARGRSICSVVCGTCVKRVSFCRQGSRRHPYLSSPIPRCRSNPALNGNSTPEVFIYLLPVLSYGGLHELINACRWIPV